MKFYFPSLLGLVLMAGTLSAQTSVSGMDSSTDATSPRARRAVIAGTVIKDPTGEPVKKAVIEVIAENQTTGGNYTATTGADGRFHVEGIAPGIYRLFVERTGYLEADKHRPRADGRVLTLAAGQELKDILIRVQAAAVVEGRVTDEDGEPLPNAQVAVLRQTFTSGRSRWETAGGQPTNDLGEYRIANLPAGSYYVSVTPPPDFKSLIEGAGGGGSEPRDRTISPEKPVPTTYMTTFYPGTRDRSQAAPIELHAGDDFPANFSLTPSPSVVIRGSIANLPVDASALVVLQSRELNMTQSAAQVHKNGSFELRDVSPGTYTIVATVSDGSGTKMALQSVQVGSINVDALRLVPQAGGWIRGRLRSQSKSMTGRLTLSQAFLSLVAADGDDVSSAMPIGEGFSPQAHVGADGSFEWKSVPPGHYNVQFSGDISESPDWYLKSVMAGGRDATDSGFSVNGGAAILDVVASSDGAIVDGVVTNSKGEPVADSVVVAVPEAHLRTRVDRFRKTVSDQSGRFILHGIPPGAYTLIAWESVDGEAYYNPEFLRGCEGLGRALHLSEGERQNVLLTVVPASEDPQ